MHRCRRLVLLQSCLIYLYIYVYTHMYTGKLMYVYIDVDDECLDDFASYKSM